MLLRVLCLHGSQQTKETFRARIGKLPHKARHLAEFTWVDGPHELELRPGDDVPTRTWWRYTSGPAARSQTMKESMQFLEQVWQEQGPFDGVLGFSMGGTMACALAAQRERFPGLKFVMVGGAPPVSDAVELWGGPLEECHFELPSFHAMGESDQVVLMSESMRLASQFKNPDIMQHEQGHCFPTNRAGFERYLAFLTRVHMMLDGEEVERQDSGKSETLCESNESAQEQRDELEALLSIYPDTVQVIQNAPERAGEPCAKLKAKIHQGEIELFLCVEFSADYPATSPRLKLEHKMDMLHFPHQAENNLMKHLEEEVASQLGMPCAYAVISTAEAWLSDEQNLSVAVSSAQKMKANPPAPSSSNNETEDCTTNNELGNVKIWEEEDEEKETQMVTEATREACESVRQRLKQEKNDFGQVALARGVKRFIVGLVGKPSAGKSTFFNCITRLQNKAKVAAHPFTTIEPNFGTGWWVSLDPDDQVNANEAGSRHGRDAQGRRLLPLLIKDVAGLIPGAYKGQGKGNRFLNDLCDADVLIHVVDVSGSSDKNGVAVASGDASASTAAQDIKWVREELHRWIFGNVSAKWRSVVRSSRTSEKAGEERLLSLFSGYQGSRSAVKAAAFRANLDITEIRTWTRLDLHRLVAHFLSVRFPMCLALNKADRVFATKSHEKIQQAMTEAAEQGYLAVTCSAMVETNLLALAKNGAIAYDLGAQSFSISDKDNCLAAFKGDENKMKGFFENANRVFGEIQGTGVLNCVTQAILLRQPVLVYPVADLKSGLPVLGKQGGKVKDSNTAAYRDCVQALPGSTVEDIFNALKRGVFEEFRMDGDFIRAEGTTRASGGAIRQVGKDTVLDSSVAVLKILTNKKPVWQQK